MKKQYEAPVAEKIEFCYRDQVVASTSCKEYWSSPKGSDCTQDSEGYNQ